MAQQPTVGRKLWYRAYPHEMAYNNHTQPLDATVTHVRLESAPNPTDTLVNLFVINEVGVPFAANGVVLAQDRPANVGECEWMPYQQAQQKKAEEAVIPPVVPTL